MEEPGWIKSSDRLPTHPDDYQVIILSSDGITITPGAGYWDGESWWVICTLFDPIEIGRPQDYNCSVYAWAAIAAVPKYMLDGG